MDTEPIPDVTFEECPDDPPSWESFELLNWEVQGRYIVVVVRERR